MAQVAPHRAPSVDINVGLPTLSDSKELPEGKSHHYFLSHKKTHSVYGGVPEQVAKNFHDSLELLGFKGWFDIDNLKRINEEDLRSAIGQCCSVIILLHDETMDSQWCTFEWRCAQELGVPCKVVVDMERASKSQLLTKANEYSNLLEFQWLEFTDRHRRDCLREMIDFLETFRIGSAGQEAGQSGAARDDDDTLTFGRAEIEVVPPFMQKLLNWSGNPLRPPKTIGGRAYVLMLHGLRLSCFLLCISRFIYARGPSISERHSCLVMVLAHLLWLVTPPVINDILFSSTFRDMLKDMEGSSGEETAKRLTHELKKATAPAIGGILPSMAIVNLAFMPSYLSAFHTGPDAAIGDRFFGYFSAALWPVALLGLMASNTVTAPLVQLIFEVDLHQFA